MDTDTADRLWNAVNTLTQALQLCNCPSSDPSAAYFRKVQALAMRCDRAANHADSSPMPFTGLRTPGNIRARVPLPARQSSGDRANANRAAGANRVHGRNSHYA